MKYDNIKVVLFIHKNNKETYTYAVYTEKGMIRKLYSKEESKYLDMGDDIHMMDWIESCRKRDIYKIIL